MNNAVETSKERTEQKQAEDIAYTINHSLYCTLTDFLNPPINAATDGWLRWLVPGCGHDHSHDDGHHHHHHDHHEHGPTCKHHHHEKAPQGRWEKIKKATGKAFSKERFMQYAKGEFIGDFGAVPLTIGVQRMFPGFMDSLRTISEPIMGQVFRWGVERDSKKWAQRNDIGVDSKEFKEHTAKVYEYEMSHFPQAIVWTGFSLGLNTAYQMFADKTPIPFAKKLALKTTSVLSGVVVTAGVVVAARALMPNKMHDFDSWMSRTAILPATKATGKLFGLKNEDVDRMVEKHEEIKGESWSARVKTREAITSPDLNTLQHQSASTTPAR